MAYRTWRAAGSWAVLSEVSEDVRRRRLTREITTFRRTAGGTYRRDAERHVAWVARPAEVAALLRAEGFSVRTSRRYGACELPPRRIAFRARRPRCAPSRPGAPDTRPRGPARPRPERT